MCSTPAEKQVLQKAGLGLKKIKFSVEDDEVTVYNQLTGTVEFDETAAYPQLKNYGGFELLRCIPNCKVLEPVNRCCDVSKKLESSSRTRENIHPSNTKIFICYSPKVSNLFLLILSVKGKICLLFERVSTPKFTSTRVNVFIIKLLVR